MIKENRFKHISFYLFNKLLSLIYWTGIIVCIFILSQIFCFRAFKIPSNSMEPTLIAGDHIIVCKMIPGARIFNLLASMRNEQVKISRLPGINNIQRNDVVVFNFPYPNNVDKIEMHLLTYLVKRCVGLPGDTLNIQNGNYKIHNIQDISENKKPQKNRSSHKDPFCKVPSFLKDSIINWNIQNIGPLYIPKTGDSIQMNRTNFVLYKKLIEWEQKNTLTYIDSTVYLNNKCIAGYRFEKNYYFMAGDYAENSQDSRYWGLLPEDFIVGKAWFIWKSKDDYTGHIRWNRIMKYIH